MKYMTGNIADNLVLESPLIDEILETRRKELGIRYLGYRNHCLRMLNFGRWLVPEEPYRDERFAIMAALHDLPFFCDGNLDYIGTACELADDYLDGIGHPEWKAEMRLMIENHHKVRRYTGPSAPMVDAMRRADWIDVSFTKLRMGVDKDVVRAVRRAFPINEAYKGLAIPAICRYAVRHLHKPLPMMRW